MACKPKTEFRIFMFDRVSADESSDIESMALYSGASDVAILDYSTYDYFVVAKNGKLPDHKNMNKKLAELGHSEFIGWLEEQGCKYIY